MAREACRSVANCRAQGFAESDERMVLLDHLAPVGDRAPQVFDHRVELIERGIETELVLLASRQHGVDRPCLMDRGAVRRNQSGQQVISDV